MYIKFKHSACVIKEAWIAINGYFDTMNFYKPLKFQVIGKTMQTISPNACTSSLALLPKKAKEYKKFVWKFKRKMIKSDLFSLKF